MRYEYQTEGTCSRRIVFEVEDGVVKDVAFEGGCKGSLPGIASLVRGMKVEDVIERLKGVPCGEKGTSCPDQLARALAQTL